MKESEELQETDLESQGVKITNLTNSPYDLQSENGPVRIPAMGSVTGEFSGSYLELLQLCGAVKIEPCDQGNTEQTKKRGRGRPPKMELT